MAQYRMKLPVVDAVLYDNTVTLQQAQNFLAGTTWASAGYTIHPQTRAVTIIMGDTTAVVPLGSWIIKHANGSVHAMSPAAFAAAWEAI